MDVPRFLPLELASVVYPKGISTHLKCLCNRSVVQGMLAVSESNTTAFSLISRDQELSTSIFAAILGCLRQGNIEEGIGIQTAAFCRTKTRRPLTRGLVSTGSSVVRYRLVSRATKIADEDPRAEKLSVLISCEGCGMVVAQFIRNPLLCDGFKNRAGTYG